MSDNSRVKNLGAEYPHLQSCKIEQRFDASFTFNSGQVFRWISEERSSGDWIGVIEGNLVRVKGDSITLVARSKGETTEFVELVPRYFSLSDNLDEIFSSFPKDDLFLKDCVSEFPGLRLLTQDPWECLISFVCSINCNIPSIRLKIENLSEKFGERIEAGLDRKFYSFPTSRSLAKAEKSDLLSCKLGFRWKYLKFIAMQVERGILDLSRISSMIYPDAMSELLSEKSHKTFGVGPKVADCVLLYSFHRKQAFPLDVWILKYLRQAYGNENQLPVKKSLTSKNYFMIGEAMRSRYGDNAGYAQLFLYEKIRRGGLTQSKAQV